MCLRMCVNDFTKNRGSKSSFQSAGALGAEVSVILLNPPNKSSGHRCAVPLLRRESVTHININPPALPT